jgi:CubicO group peptidase (beta-lactamase class C family)
MLPRFHFAMPKVIAVLAAIPLMAGAGMFARVEAEPGATAPSAAKLERLSEFFEGEVATGKLAGAMVLIQQHGVPVYLRGFGVRNVATGQPMTPDTLFALHSMTKPITNLAAMMLIDEGGLALADPVSKYIPAFAPTKVGVQSETQDGQPILKLVAPNRPVTVEDLMRQTSGLSYDYIGGDLIRAAYAKADVLHGKLDNRVLADRVAGLPLVAQPGTLWRYGYSTDVLGRIIEIASGKSLFQFLKMHIFDPLGMTSTRFVLESPAEQARMAKPLPSDAVLLLSEKQRLANPEWESGGGGLISSITDYAMFAQMLLDGGKSGGRQFLSLAAFRQMTTDHIGPGAGVARDYFYFPGDGFGYGYGIAVRTDPGIAWPPPPGPIGELKWDGGSGTYFGVVPELDMIYLLMEQTEQERGRVLPTFKKLVYDAFAP